MELQNKKIAVLGTNKEGIAFLKALNRKGARVTGYGTASTEEEKQIWIKELGRDSIPIIWKPEEGLDLSTYDLILYTTMSGQYAAAMKRAKSQGVSVYWDLDFVTSFLKAPIIAVTGTNGKSTTVAMLQEMLKRQGLKTTVTGGDFDSWGARLSDVGKFDYHLMELSSQRLENSTGFRPHIALLLNIFLTHRARHKGGIPAYFAAKAKIFENQGDKDYLIHEATAVNIRELIRRNGAKAQPVMFSMDKAVDAPGIYREGNQLIWNGGEGVRESYPLSKPHHKNPILLLNFMAAIAAARLAGTEPPAIQTVLDQFTGLPHRMEKVRTVSQVHFVDDSRATNFGATVWALSSFEQPLWLIMGGEPDPGSDIEVLNPILSQKVKGVICVGMKRNQLKDQIKDIVPTQTMDSLQEAVEAAYRAAKPKEVVLFSPGCHPDIYSQGGDNERGEAFQSIVQNLPEIQRTLRPKPTFTRI